MKEKKARIEDALHATRAAIEEGIVPGGGVALVRCIEAVEELKLKGDEKTGADIVVKAIKMPCYCIADNAGATAQSGRQQGRARARAASATTPTRTSMRTWSKPASSTRPRSRASPCRTPSASPVCC